MSEPLIHVEDGSVLRGSRPVLRGVNVRVERGTCLGVIGPNGSGKTTLLLGLRGQLSCAGTWRLDGRDPTSARRGEIARKVGVVPQRMEFAFPYRVDEMVLLGRSPHRRPWEAYRREDRDRVASILDRLGLTPLAEARVDALSGGERRKVFLARALAQDTPILFLDEPTAGLDPPAQEELGRLVAELREREGKTIVVVLHDLRIARGLCDHIVGLRDGEQRKYGPTDDVLAPGPLEELFGVAWVRYAATGHPDVLLPEGGS